MVTLSLNVVLQLRDLLIVTIYNIFLLSGQLCDLVELVLFLGCKLFFVFHLQIISNLLAIFVHTLHVLESDLEVVKKLLNISIVSVVQPFNLIFEEAFHLVLGLLELSELLLLIL